MRRNPTLAESRLWKALRRLDVAGSHFRRQVAFGPYVADFACHHHRLIIEVDGGVHDLELVAAKDAERQSWLEARGYALIRIPNEQAIFDTDAAIQHIVSSLRAGSPTPNPSPQGGGGR